MEIIDIHTHIFPDALAESAISYLENEADTKAFLDGTEADLRKSMQEAGIRLSVQQPVATKPSQVRRINEWAKKFVDVNNGILSFGGMHPGCDDLAGEMKRMKEQGFKGFKLHPEYQKFYPDDPDVFHMYEAAMENDMIVFFHTGEDIGVKPPYFSTPDRMSRLLETFPYLKLVYAHMGGWMLWDDVERLIIGKEVYLETSYTMGHIT
ncbi:MAG TPA: amidohydrolase family protein, partial [candidate division Zixibacteria bacterium]|nr:amidohydrolase family protein [candidate division Zixibacteria bacterium]